ncbi:hypothetical protein L1987_68747 [Smallanthus sonchifolius]|uniref:Uncharacterized protein n=1 Tax=Smallanthus sonchifolius TaxID=185202 RepID=A0ACB9B651_9ASTR|nr:hypothetical protein L1987_68747 [Smallanthus sonchifolius]
MLKTDGPWRGGGFADRTSEEHFYQSRFLSRSQVMEHPSLPLRKPFIAVSIPYAYESKVSLLGFLWD